MYDNSEACTTDMRTADRPYYQQITASEMLELNLGVGKSRYWRELHHLAPTVGGCVSRQPKQITNTVTWIQAPMEVIEGVLRGTAYEIGSLKRFPDGQITSEGDIELYLIEDGSDGVVEDYVSKRIHNIIVQVTTSARRGGYLRCDIILRQYGCKRRPIALVEGTRDWCKEITWEIVTLLL